MFFDAPKYDTNVAVKKALIKLGEQPVYENFGVCITNAEEMYVNWKYNEQSKFIVFYEATLDEIEAKKLKHELCSLGIKDLIKDPVGVCDNRCKNVFIRALLKTEVFESEYPEGS